jgi:hypothetical protein
MAKQNPPPLAGGNIQDQMPKCSEGANFPQWVPILVRAIRPDGADHICDWCNERALL